MKLLERITNIPKAVINYFVDQPPPPKTDGQEMSAYASPYYLPSMVRPYNPDSLVRQKGGLDVYRKMMVDDQVKAVVAMKMNAIFASGYKFEPASEEPGDTEVCDFIEHCFGDGLGVEQKSGGKTMVSNFKQALMSILSALIYGFSVTEKVYKTFEDGEYAGKIGLRCLKTRPAHSFELHTDEYNNLIMLRQNSITGVRDFKDQDLDYFMVYSYHADNSDFSNWYGVSDLRAAYRPWFGKDMIIKFLNIFLERFGMGIVHGKYPRGMGQPEIDALEDMVNNISTRTGFVTPESVAFEILESKSRGQSPFIDTIKIYDAAIARSVLVPNMLGFTDISSGTYNLGEKHFDLFMMILNNIRTEIEELINEQLVKELVDYNFVVEEYPVFKFKPLTEDDKEALANIFINAVEKGVVLATEDDEDYLRESINFPKRKDDAVLLPQKPVAQPFGSQPPVDPNKPAPAPGAKPPVSAKKGMNPEQIQEFALRMNRQPSPYEQRVDFKTLTDDLDKIELDAALGITDVISKMKNSLYSTITEKGIVANKDSAAANRIGLDFLKDLKLEWADALRKGFDLGLTHARGEITAVVGAKAAFALGSAEVVGNIPPAQIMEYFTQRAFFFTGAMKDDILKNVKAQLLDGIRSGLSNADVIKNLESYFDKYTVRQLTGQGVSTAIQNIPGRIETIVRTNFNDAYNQGRLTMFQAPDVAPFIAAYQYSAIVDDRTTGICRDLDGKIYKADNPIWAQITPPNHYNCRSLLIPIFVGEDFVESDPPLIMPDKGFGGTLQ